MIAIASTPREIDACYPVMSQLRPKIRREDFVQRVEQLAAATGLALAYLEDGGVKAVAGYRISDWLAGGRVIGVSPEGLTAAFGWS